MHDSACIGVERLIGLDHDGSYKDVPELGHLVTQSSEFISYLKFQQNINLIIVATYCFPVFLVMI